MKRAIVTILVVGFVGYLSPRVLITILFITAGKVSTSLILSASNKSGFQWPVVFHQGCATAHWAFISFYLFSFDKIRTDLFLRPIDILIVVLIVSFVLCIRGSLTTRKVLQHENPSFLTTKEERENMSFAALLLLVALYFANLLIQTPLPR